MKKTIVMSLIASSMLFAADQSYRIFAITYNSPSNKNLILIKRMVQEKLKNNPNVLNVVARASDKWGVVVANTKKVDETTANSILNEVRTLKYSHDAFMRININNEPMKAPIVPDPDEKQEVKQDVQPQAEVEPKVNPEEVLPVLADDSNNTNINAESNTDNSQIKPDNVVTLSDAISTVLSSNPNIREAELVYQQTGKDLGIANSAYYPVLNINGQYGIRREISKTNGATTYQKGTGSVASIGATLTENIYNGGADVSRQHEQSSRLDAAAYSVLQAADRFSLQMIESYLNVIKTKKLLDIAEENVKSHRNIYQQIKERVESGFGKISEQRQAGSRLTLAESNRIAASSNYQDAVTTFAKFYGKPLQADQLVEPTFTLPLPTTLQEVTNRSIQCNPSVLLQDANIKVAQFAYEGTKAPFLPKLDLQLSANYQGDNVLNKDPGNRTKDYGAMLQLNYNIYNRGVDKLNREKSALGIESSYQDMDKTKRELDESMNFSWHSYVLNAKKLDFLNEHVNYAKATLDSYQDEFKIGRRDLINLLDAENEYFTAIKEVAETKSDLLLAKYRLLDNMGMLTDSFKPGFGKSYIQGACSIQDNLK